MNCSVSCDWCFCELSFCLWNCKLSHILDKELGSEHVYLLHDRQAVEHVSCSKGTPQAHFGNFLESNTFNEKIYLMS